MRFLYSFYFLFILSLFVSCNGNDEEAIDKSISQDIFIDLNEKAISEKQAWLDQLFNRLHKRHGFIGTVLYAEKGQIIYENAFGFSDLRKRDSLKISSSFQLASVSKMFTATAIMILKQEGKVDYDVDIVKYLPDFPYQGITIRMLLTHRSGLSRYMTLAHKHWKDKGIPLTNKAMYQLFLEHKPSTYAKPNQIFHYCNTNYAMLANIVEEVSGLPFNSYMSQNIFEPLKMNNSFVYHMNQDERVSAYISEGVPGYRYKGWRPIKQRNEYLNGVMGDKGVYSSVGDLFKFDQALNNGLLVHDSILQDAFIGGSPQSKRRKDNYGFGWRIRGAQDSTVYHYGWWKGFRAFYIRDMKQERTILVLSNREKGPGSTSFWNVINSKRNPMGKWCSIEDSLTSKAEDTKANWLQRLTKPTAN